MNNLMNSLQKNKKIIDEKLMSFFSNKREEFLKIDSSLVELLDNVSNQTLRSGKRVRPFLAKMAYEISGGQNQVAIQQLGVSLELLHQYFMVHDDIVDRDEKRYGGDSLHKTYGKIFAEKYRQDDSHLGLSLGMIGGDLLNSLAVEALIDLPMEDGVKSMLISQMIQTVYETTAGWQMHFFMNHEKIENVSEKNFLKGMQLVSAKYTFEAPIKMGLILSQKMDSLEAFENFAFNAGMAYQIRDDILGMFGNSDNMGKPVGNDFREGKKTLLILKSYQNSSIEQKLYLSELLGNNIDQKQLDEVKDLIVETGGLEYATQMANMHADKAREIVNILPNTKEQNQKQILLELIDFLINRDS